MQAMMITGHTRICGKSQGFLGLPVRDEFIPHPFLSSEGYNVMHTAWEPTQEELVKLLNGGKVIISLIGNNPQPIQVNVGE